MRIREVTHTASTARPPFCPVLVTQATKSTTPVRVRGQPDGGWLNNRGIFLKPETTALLLALMVPQTPDQLAACFLVYETPARVTKHRPRSAGGEQEALRCSAIKAAWLGSGNDLTGPPEQPEDTEETLMFTK